MALVFRNSTVTGGSGAPGADPNLVITLTVNAAGDLLLFYSCDGTSTGDIVSMTDSQGNTWNRIITSGGVGSIFSSVWYAIASASGTLTITLIYPNHGINVHPRTVAADYSGQASSNPIDASAFAEESGTGVSLSVTTNFSNEALILFSSTFGDGTTFTSTSGQTVRAVSTGATSFADSSQSSPGPITETGTWNSAQFGSNDFLISVKTTASLPDTSKSYNIDAFILPDKFYNIDADIQADTSRLYNIDAFILPDKFYNIDADIQADISKSYNIDAFIQTSPPKFYNIDADIQADTFKFYNIDADIQADTFKFYNIDADMAIDVLKSYNIDADIQLDSSKLYNADAYIQADASRLYNVDAYIQADVSKSYNIDVYVFILTLKPLVRNVRFGR